MVTDNKALVLEVSKPLGMTSQTYQFIPVMHATPRATLLFQESLQRQEILKAGRFSASDPIGEKRLCDSK